MTHETSCNLGMSYRILLPMAIVAASATLGLASAAEMRYNIKPDQIVPYRVTIVADTPAEKDTMTGVIAFIGKQSEAEQLTIEYRGGLTRKKEAKGSSSPGSGPRGFPGRSGGGPPIPRSPMSRFQSGATSDGLTQTTNKLVIGRDGEIKSLAGESQLPYLIGNLSILPFEALPAGSQKQWNFGSGVSITENSRSPFPRGPFGAREQETRTGGSETAGYTIQTDDGKWVTIRKDYRLHSPAATDDDPTLEISGNGTFVFNRELGVPESLDFKQSFIVSKSGSTVTIPMTIAWNRISEEEYQAQLKAREDQIAALREQMAQRKAQAGSQAGGGRGESLDPDKKQEIIADLRSENVARMTARLGRLMSVKPHPNDVDVANVIRDLQSHRNRGVSMQATQLWKKWSAVMDQPGAAAPAASSSVAAAENGRQMRIWTDITGSFKVEAVYVKIDGSNVLLRTKDGREINVPVSRLSDADQAIVHELKKDPGRDNPFR